MKPNIYYNFDRLIRQHPMPWTFLPVDMSMPEDKGHVIDAKNGKVREVATMREAEGYIAWCTGVAERNRKR